MKKFIYTTILLLSIPLVSFAQSITPAQGVVRVGALPATCVAVGAANSSAPVRYQGRVYTCTATNTWTFSATMTAALTAGRLPYVDTGGVLADSANATLSSTGQLAVGSTSNGGSASLTLRGYSVNATNGSYGRLLFYGNADSTSSARQWLITNASDRFRLIRSVDATTTPTINSSSVVTSGTEDFSIDINGEVGLRTAASVGTTTNGGSALFTLQGYTPNATNGIFGRMLFNANTNFSTNSRRWLVTNALNVTNFGIIRSVDALTTPTLSSVGAVTSGTADFTIDYTGVVAIPQLKIANLAFISTAPTVTSAGTSPSVTVNNGTASFRVNVGTGGTAHTVVLAMPAAAAGWNCAVNNITAAAANRADWVLRQTASTTTSVTIQMQTLSTGAALAFTASDVISCQCVAH